MSTVYMANATLDPSQPLCVIRQYGLGENILRNGDIVALTLGGAITHPEGPMWLDQARIDQLTKAERKALRKAGVTALEPIPVEVVR